MASSRRFPDLGSSLSWRHGPDWEGQQQEASIQAIATRLGVRYLLRCTAQQAGERFRIGVHLLDGASGLELWAKRFGGTMSEVFDFEDRIAESVAGLVAPAISRAEIERARRKRPDNLDAYDLYLRALPLFRTIDPNARSEVIRLLEDCVRPRPTLRGRPRSGRLGVRTPGDLWDWDERSGTRPVA